jgi:uncharacterized protein
MPYVPEEFDESPPVTMREAHEYYRTARTQHANSPNLVMSSCLDRVMAFSAFDRMESLLTQPILLVAGSEADTMYFSRRAYDKAGGKKELYVIDGAMHVAMYDVRQYVKQAVDKIAQFFAETIGNR